MTNTSSKKGSTSSKKDSDNGTPSIGLPPYQPLDLSTPPQHLFILNKKIRATKKKIRKINEAEQRRIAGKKLNPEQERSLADKIYYERSLKDFEEIRDSLQKLDLTLQLRMLLGIFFMAANTSSETLRGLSAVLLPPSNPDPNCNPLDELQQAAEVAKKFLQGDDEELFSQPPTTYAEARESVLKFLDPANADYFMQSRVVSEELTTEPTADVSEPETEAETEAQTELEPEREVESDTTPVESISKSESESTITEVSPIATTEGSPIDHQQTSDQPTQIEHDPNQTGESNQVPSGTDSDTNPGEKRRNSNSRNYKNRPYIKRNRGGYSRARDNGEGSPPENPDSPGNRGRNRPRGTGRGRGSYKSYSKPTGTKQQQHNHQHQNGKAPNSPVPTTSG